MDHLNTLTDYHTNKILVQDVVFYFGIPAFSGIVCGLQDVSISDQATGSIIGGLSILAGLLFSFLILLFNLTEKIDYSQVDPNERNRRLRLDLRLRMTRETYANSSFAILVALFTIGLLIIEAFGLPAMLGRIVSGLSIASSLVFVLTLVMVLSRVYSLYTDEANSKSR